MPTLPKAFKFHLTTFRGALSLFRFKLEVVLTKYWLKSFFFQRRRHLAQWHGHFLLLPLVRKAGLYMTTRNCLSQLSQKRRGIIKKEFHLWLTTVYVSIQYKWVYVRCFFVCLCVMLLLRITSPFQPFRPRLSATQRKSPTATRNKF